MPLNAWVMRYRMGEIQGAEEGRALIAKAEAAIKAQAVVSPGRWSRMIAPGFSRIATLPARNQLLTPSDALTHGGTTIASRLPG